MSQSAECLTALALIERRLDSLPVRLAGRLWMAWRATRRTLHPAMTSEALAVVEGLDDNPERLLRALGLTLDAGALETATVLLERLRRQAFSLTTSAARQARVREVSLLLALGEREAARAVSEVSRVELAATAEGSALLELLGWPSGAELPGGDPNLLGMSHRIADGQLTAEEMARLLQSRALWQVRFPELQLLFFSALRSEPQLAVRYLNRFLGAHGLAPLSVDESRVSGNALARLRGHAGRPARRGPLVSVVVAAHDCAGTLGYALDSLLRQSYEFLEILVVDDGSRDETLAVMRPYAADSRVRLFRSTENQGAYNARNALAQRARGELLTFHDADDWALPTRIEQQVTYLRRERALGCVTSLLRVRPDGSVVFFKNQRATRLSRVSLMLRREAFVAVGQFRSARVGADEELHAKIRSRYGHAALGRLRAPLMLSLWSATSATRHPGTEALEDGYRAQPRRVYSELVFRKHSLGWTLSDAEVDERLRETGNYVAAREVVEVT